MADCFFHTGRPAVTRCKQCGKPLCSDCRHVTELGVFCGEKCADTAKVFASRLQQIEQQKAARKKSVSAAVTGIVKIIILIAVLFALYKFVVVKFLR